MKLTHSLLITALTLPLFALFSHNALAEEYFVYTPTMYDDFTMNHDGTATHRETGLTWKVCSEGQTWNQDDNSCTGTPTYLTWQEALQVPIDLNQNGGFAGHQTWRVPNIKELSSIIDFSRHDPAISLKVFNNTPAKGYWTSSPYDYNFDFPCCPNLTDTWKVDFYDGAGFYVFRESTSYLRLVRN